MIDIVNKLASTGNANKRFKAYYEKQSMYLTLDFTKFLKQDFRYLVGVFTDYLRKENIGILSNPKGFMLYILDPTALPDNDKNAEFLYELVYDEFYIIQDKNDIRYSDNLNMDIVLQENNKLAIISAMKLIHAMKKGFNKNY